MAQGRGQLAGPAKPWVKTSLAPGSRVVMDYYDRAGLIPYLDKLGFNHIAPARAIKADSPAGRYLLEHGAQPRDFNSYGSQRGNHEVMMVGLAARPHQYTYRSYNNNISWV